MTTGNPNPSPATRFPPGTSGNPGGRPKDRTLTERLRDALAVEAPEPKHPGETLADRMVAALVALATGTQTEADRQAIKDIFERVDGKPTEHLVIDDARKSYEVANSPESI